MRDHIRKALKEQQEKSQKGKILRAVIKISDDFLKQFKIVLKFGVRYSPSDNCCIIYILFDAPKIGQGIVFMDLQEKIEDYLGVGCAVLPMRSDTRFDKYIQEDRERGYQTIVIDYSSPENLSEQNSGVNHKKMLKAVAHVLDGVQKNHPDIKKAFIGVDRFDERIFVNICSKNEKGFRYTTRRQAFRDALNDYLGLGEGDVFVWDYTDDKVFTEHMERDIKDIALEYIYRDYTPQKLNEQKAGDEKMTKAVIKIVQQLLKDYDYVRRACVVTYGTDGYSILVEYEEDELSHFNPEDNRSNVILDIQKPIRDYLGVYNWVYPTNSTKVFNDVVADRKTKNYPIHIINFNHDMLSEQKSEEDKMLKAVSIITNNYLKNFDFVKKALIVNTKEKAERNKGYAILPYTIYVSYTTPNEDSYEQFSQIKELKKNINDYLGVDAKILPTKHSILFDNNLADNGQYPHQIIDYTKNQDMLSEQKSREEKMVQAIKLVVDNYIKDYDFVPRYAILDDHLVKEDIFGYQIILEIDRDKIAATDISLHPFLYGLQDAIEDYLSLKCKIYRVGTYEQLKGHIEYYGERGSTAHLIDCSNDQEMLSENSEEKMFKAVVQISDNYLKNLGYVKKALIYSGPHVNPARKELQYKIVAMIDAESLQQEEERKQEVGKLKEVLLDYLNVPSFTIARIAETNFTYYLGYAVRQPHKIIVYSED